MCRLYSSYPSVVYLGHDVCNRAQHTSNMRRKGFATICECVVWVWWVSFTYIKLDMVRDFLVIEFIFVDDGPASECVCVCICGCTLGKYVRVCRLCGPFRVWKNRKA